MKITKKNLEKLIIEEITTLLDEKDGSLCTDHLECLDRALQKNATGDARSAFVNLVRALKFKGVF